MGPGSDAFLRRGGLLLRHGEIRLFQNAVLLFQPQNPPHGFVHPGLVDFAALHQGLRGIHIGLREPEKIRILHAGQDQHIHPGVHCIPDDVFRAEVVGHRRHVQRVGHDHAVKPQISPQNVRQNRPAHGGRQIHRLPGGNGGQGFLLNLGILDMGRHDHVRPGLDGRPEGDQLAGLQLLIGQVDQRKTGVAVGAGVAVAGKMLQRGHHALRVQPLQKGAPEGRDGLRIVGEGPDADHRIVRIVVHVHHRREIGVDPQQAHLLPEDGGHDPGVFGIARGPQRHVAHALGAEADPVHVAALLVREKDLGQPAAGLVHRPHLRNQPEGLLRAGNIFLKQQNAAEMIPSQHLPDRPVQLRNVLPGRFGFRRGFRLRCRRGFRLRFVLLRYFLPGPEGGNHHLRHLIPQAHARQDRFDAAGLRFLREGKRPQGQQGNQYQTQSFFHRRTTVLELFQKYTLFVYIRCSPRDFLRSCPPPSAECVRSALLRSSSNLLVPFRKRKKAPEPESLPVRGRRSAGSYLLPSRARPVKPIMTRGRGFFRLSCASSHYLYIPDSIRSNSRNTPH